MRSRPCSASVRIVSWWPRADRILVAPCAVDPIDPQAPEERPSDLPKGRPFLLMVGPGGANKNALGALEGFARYLADYPHDTETLFVLAGSLRYQAETINTILAENAFLRQRVLCLGYVSNAQRHYLYRRARMLIYPSRYEGFGIPPLEAMSYGIPALVADIPVLREVTDDAALRFPLDQPEALAEAIHHLNADETLRQTLITRGQARVNAYSWERSGRASLEALLALGTR